jgi:predicted alpha/beta-hydrolase family hydrolase
MSATSGDRVALVVPGREYGPQAPLLAYAAAAAAARGADIRTVHWRPPPELIRGRSASSWVRSHVAPLLNALPSAPLIVGKSLGTYAAPLIAERSLSAVWLTPLLNDQLIVAALQAATAPMLLIGGTADETWDGTLARKLSPHVLEVDDADHGLYVRGPLAASAAVLGLVATAVERFLDDVVWRRGS